jgi:hypothetical protein
VATLTQQVRISNFYDPATSTLAYLVFDPASRDAVVIDPVMELDPASGHTHDRSGSQHRARGITDDVRNLGAATLEDASR